MTQMSHVYSVKRKSTRDTEFELNYELPLCQLFLSQIHERSLNMAWKHTGYAQKKTRLWKEEA